MATSKILIASAVLFFAAFAAAGPNPFANPNGPNPFECRVNPNTEARNGIIDKRLRWPNGVVFYRFADDATDDDKRVILAGMRDVSKETCIRFRQRTNQRNYIQFAHKDSDGCVSRIGMNGGAQPLNLAKPGCMQPFIAAHEIIHALGFWHEQQRDDRDEHIKVIYENIEDDAYDQFDKADTDHYKTYGPYDLDSVMHYYNTAFTKNGGRTMEAIEDPERQLGNTNGLTAADRAKIRNLYECRR